MDSMPSEDRKWWIDRINKDIEEEKKNEKKYNKSSMPRFKK